MEKFDKIIIGAGLYGIYAAHYCGKKGQKILVLEYDNEPFKRRLISIRLECIWDIIILDPFLQR